MNQYIDLLRHVLEHGKFKADRAGTGTFSVFGAQIRRQLRESFPLLTTTVARVCGLKPGEFIHAFGDLHLYSKHVEPAKLQTSREPRPLPRTKLNPAVKDIHDFKFEDFELVGCDPHPVIKAPVAV